MRDAEYWIIGGVFALCALSFFCVMVPRYALRHLGPGRPPPLPQGKVKTTGMGILDVIGVGLFFALYAGSWLVMQHGPEEAGAGKAIEMGPVMLLGELVLQVMMVGFVIAILCWRANIFELFGLRWRQAWLAPVIAVVVVMMIFSLNVFLAVVGYNEWMADLAGMEDPSQDAVKLIRETKDPLTLVLMAILACVGAPIAEEVIFRGYIYAVVKKLCGIWFAVIFTGLLFSVVHMNLAGLLPLLVLGVALALAYELTGSLWAPMAVHFLFNSTSVGLILLSKIAPEWVEGIEKL